MRLHLVQFTQLSHIRLRWLLGSIDRLEPFCELVLVGNQLAVNVESHSVAEIHAATCDLLAAIRDAGFSKFSSRSKKLELPALVSLEIG